MKPTCSLSSLLFFSWQHKLFRTFFFSLTETRQLLQNKLRQIEKFLKTDFDANHSFFISFVFFSCYKRCKYLDMFVLGNLFLSFSQISFIFSCEQMELKQTFVSKLFFCWLCRLFFGREEIGGQRGAFSCLLCWDILEVGVEDLAYARPADSLLPIISPAGFLPPQSCAAAS